MVLILGGTTEGRIAASTLEEAGKPYYYSTKGGEQDITLHHGIKVGGGMDSTQMQSFCEEHGIRLLIDAAHPFASLLHETVRQASDALHIPVIRLERIYPEHDRYPSIIWCRDYDEAISLILSSGIQRLLALTGVQTISRLRPLWQDGGVRCIFRILDRDSSRRIAQSQDFPQDDICYYHNEEDNLPLMRRLSPDAIILKESGITGGFSQKVEAAFSLSISIYCIRRPQMPGTFITVNGEHGLRLEVQRILPDYYPLHSGITTGTCATAAAVAAVRALLTPPTTDTVTVPVILPNGETIKVPATLTPQQLSTEESSTQQQLSTFNSKLSTKKLLSTVIKFSGDDPDITDGIPIQAQAEITAPTSDEYTVIIRGGKGVGTVTLLGLGLPIGSPAINETPQRMIRENVIRTLRQSGAPTCTVTVTISVLGGEEIAARTFNPRLGVTGGISIIGTTGIVKPYSTEAFIHSIRKYLEVARATGTPTVIIHSGAKSERYLRPLFPDLPQQAFVQYGNFIGETLKLCDELGIKQVVLAMMIGKAVKLAEGHLDTHSRKSAMNRDFILAMAAEAGCPQSAIARIQSITMARELWSIIPSDSHDALAKAIITHCRTHCAPLLPDGNLRIILLSEDGKTFS